MTTDHTLVIAVLFVIVIPVAMLLFMTVCLVQRRRAVRATAALTGQPGNESQPGKADQSGKTDKTGRSAQTAHDEGTR